MDYIKSENVKKLYKDLLAFCSKLKNFTTEQRNTTKYDFRLYDTDDKWVFAFLVNNNHLRFYLMTNALKNRPSIRNFAKSKLPKLDNKHTKDKDEYALNFDTQKELRAIKQIISYY